MDSGRPERDHAAKPRRCSGLNCRRTIQIKSGGRVSHWIRGDLHSIVTATALSVATVANMKRNLAFAFVYSAFGIPLAAGLLYPFNGWLLSPMIAALAMSLSSASVIGNTLRFRSSAIGEH